MSDINIFKPNPNLGQRIDPNYCRASVWGGWYDHQCRRKAVVEEEGYWWCRQHAPSAARERRKKTDARVEREIAKMRLRSKRGEIANIAIAMFRQEAAYDDLEKAVMEYERMKREAEE